MGTALLLGVLVTGIVVLTPLADRLRLPQPVLLTLFGLLVPLLPGIPALRLEPDLILPVVLPPLLFAATQRSSAREFRDNASAITLLAVGLTVASTAAVAVACHAMGVAWGPAWVLGAVVAPPDPVAATAVARSLRLPGRLVTVLEGEGMFNDATALVLYNVAVAGVVTGEVSAWGIASELLLAVGLGVAVGLAGGLLARSALAALHDRAAETTVTIAAPFAVYLLADELRGSGVLAVLSLGLFLRSYGHPALTSAGWLLGRAVWSYADFVITSIVFVLIGFELTQVLDDSPVTGELAATAAVVLAVLVVVRFIWMFPAAALVRAIDRRGGTGSPVGQREIVVVAWAGMRGVVTVATALALPATTLSGRSFPSRGAIVFIALACVLVTLAGQGMTLAPLVRRLKVGSEADTEREVARLRVSAARAALEAVRGPQRGSPVEEAVRRAAVTQYQGYLQAQEALEAARRADGDDDTGAALEDLLRRASEIERDTVLRARRLGTVSAEAADEVLDDIEMRAARDIR